MPSLTIGMAHYDDFDGALFSIQSLALYHSVPDLEIILIDNSPDTPAGQSLAKQIKSWHTRNGVKVRYIAMPENTGTTQPRERIFAEASNDVVMVMDCHVLLATGAIEKLMAYYEANPDSGDILSGPLLYNDLQSISTHFQDEWRSEMWGTWGTDERGRDPNGEPFEIPGQGLGLFVCRKDKWLGFNPHFRGFGGEEMYIHEKFRQHGRKAMCLPSLRWWHRFDRPAGVRYPLTRWNKVRNYVLGHQELGLPLDRPEEHFVGGGLFPREHWERLVADPIGMLRSPAELPIVKQDKPAAASSCGSRQQPPEAVQSIEELFTSVKAIPRDLEQHADTIRAFAAKAGRVSAFVTRREWNVFLAAGKPSSLIVYQTEQDPLLDRLHAAWERDIDNHRHRHYTTKVGGGADSLIAEPIEPTDMLVIDTVHTGPRLYAELARHGGQTERFIMLHDTEIYGQNGEQEKAPGLLSGLQRWIKEHPEWFVVYHTKEQYGLTVLGRQERDRPEEPIHLWAPGYGPGTELKAIISSLGINPSASCDCNAKARQMDQWGVAGCREHRDEIIGWMRSGQERWKWKDKLAAAAKAVTTGLAFKLDWSDPFPSLIDEAIRRAEERATEPAAEATAA